MDLDVARKALSKRGAFSAKQKRVAFFVVAGLVLVVGILLRSGQYFGQPAEEEKAPVTVAAPPPAAAPAVQPAESVPETPPPTQETATAPNEPAEQAGDAAKQAQQPAEQPVKQAEEPAEQAEQPELPGSGMILVSKRPVEMLASPSPTASAMYGFPAGRPFRVIGREGGFAKIQDLKSGASGWIDEAALVAPPPRAPAVAAPSQAKPAPASPKPAAAANPKTKATKSKATKKNSQTTADAEPAAEPEPVQTRKQPGLFGQGGLFGGIFNNGN